MRRGGLLNFVRVKLHHDHESSRDESGRFIFRADAAHQLLAIAQLFDEDRAFAAAERRREKIKGVPLQSMMMKAALLPGYDDNRSLREAAVKAGEWLRNFHQLTAGPTQVFDPQQLLAELQTLCLNCRGEGLDNEAIQMILTGAQNSLAKSRKSISTSAVLKDFTPLSIVVTENGVGVSDYGKMSDQGISLNDAATFLASVEALEKYPFCNRDITGRVQESFLQAYGASGADQAILRVLKMRALLSMFAQGRGVKESAVRKKVMWATVMKRFIQQAASRSLAPAA